MTTFGVIREAGPASAAGGVFDQPAVDEDATLMNALAGEGFLLSAGPLAGTEAARVRELLIFEAETEADIHGRLAGDFWVRTDQLITASIEPWTLLVGAERPASVAP